MASALWRWCMSERYLQEANDYAREFWARMALRRTIPRRLVVKAGTLLALGGTSAVSQILAACSSGAQQTEQLERAVGEGQYKWSKYPMVEKYNFRNLPWGGTPYIDGTLHSGYWSGPANWN